MHVLVRCTAPPPGLFPGISGGARRIDFIEARAQSESEKILISASGERMNESHSRYAVSWRSDAPTTLVATVVETPFVWGHSRANSLQASICGGADVARACEMG
jgi:hypothetical protein